MSNAIDQTEQEIVRAGAAALEWKAHTPVDERTPDDFMAVFLDPTQASLGRSGEFFRALEDIYRMRLYDIFLRQSRREELVTRQEDGYPEHGNLSLPVFKNTEDTRRWFGAGAVLRGFGIPSFFFTDYIQGLAIPNFIELVSGNYSVCTYKNTKKLDNRSTLRDYFLVSNIELKTSLLLESVPRYGDIRHITFKSWHGCGGNMKEAKRQVDRYISSAKDRFKVDCTDGLSGDQVIRHVAKMAQVNGRDWGPRLSKGDLEWSIAEELAKCFSV